MQQNPAIAVMVRTSANPMLPLDSARVRLAALWLGLGGAILLIVIIQSLLGKFDADTQKAWGWLLPTIMPTLGMIIAVLGYTALDPSFSNTVVRKSFFWIAFFLSSMYLALILITILIQPFVPKKDPIELMNTSNLWLGPFQALVASALGVLFVSKQKKPDEVVDTPTLDPKPPLGNSPEPNGVG